MAGDMEQVSLVHVLAPAQPCPAHAAAIEVVRKVLSVSTISARSLKAYLATPDNSPGPVVGDLPGLAARNRCASAQIYLSALGSEIRVFQGPSVERLYQTARE